MGQKQRFVLGVLIICVVFWGDFIWPTALHAFARNAHMSPSLSQNFPNQQIGQLQFHLQQKIGVQELLDPKEILVTPGGDIYVIDQGSNFAITRFDSTGKFVQRFARWGRGPGEFQKIPVFAGYGRQKIFLFSIKDQKIGIYRTDGQFLADLPLPSSASAGARDTLLYLKPLMDLQVFLRAERIKNNSFHERWALTVAQALQDANELRPLAKNPLLKEGPICVDESGNVYLAFKFSSLLIGFSRQGKIIFKNTMPYQIEFPVYVKYPGEQATYSIPPANMYPYVSLDLKTDSKYLYRLYYGYRTDKFQGSPFKLIEKMDDGGTVLDVYDKKNGQYLFSTVLPVPAKRIAIQGDYIYLLSVAPEVAILKYRKPGELR
ncbi:MAG: 6-bladed beta-propeller [Calditrichaeota bacterium]|nr:MAG: 6-bladed beta-propeller [Calditrichota bacterium]